MKTALVTLAALTWQLGAVSAAQAAQAAPAAPVAPGVAVVSTSAPGGTSAHAVAAGHGWLCKVLGLNCSVG